MALVVPSSCEKSSRTRKEEKVQRSDVSFSQIGSDYHFSTEFAEWEAPMWSLRPVPSSYLCFSNAQDRSLLSNPYTQHQWSSMKLLTKSQSNIQAFDPLFYAKYSFSPPITLRSCPKRDRSEPRFVSNKTAGWEIKIDEVSPQENKNHPGGEGKERKPSFESSKSAGGDGKTYGLGKSIRQERGRMYKRAHTLSSSWKIFDMVDKQPLQFSKGEEPFFATIPVDANEYDKHSSRRLFIRRSEAWPLKDLWRMGDREVHRQENFRSCYESSSLDERPSRFSARKDIRSKGNEMGKVSGAGTETAPRASESHPSARYPKGPVLPHEVYYTTHRAHAEQKKMTTFITYRPGLLDCLGFTSKSYRSAVGMQSLHASGSEKL